MKPDWVEPVNRFRLTETIYMKLKCFALNHYNYMRKTMSSAKSE